MSDPYSKIPKLVMASAKAYVEHHKPVGNFLRAVIQNDLHTAVLAADDNSRVGLAELVMWFHWEAPSNCWGSSEVYDSWTSEFDPSSMREKLKLVAF